MTRDWNVVRDLLLSIESTAAGDCFITESDDQLQHLTLLADGGFISGLLRRGVSGYCATLTWKGLDLLDAIRDAKIWKQVVPWIEKNDGLPTDLVVELAHQLAKKPKAAAPAQ